MNDKNNLRKNRLVVHLTDDEYKEFMDDLELFDMTTSDYIRWAIFQKSITFRCKRFEPNDELYKTIRELKRIGVNINQIATRINSEDNAVIPVTDLKKALEEIHRTNIKIVDLYAHIEDDAKEYIWKVE